MLYVPKISCCYTYMWHTYLGTQHTQNRYIQSTYQALKGLNRKLPPLWIPWVNSMLLARSIYSELFFGRGASHLHLTGTSSAHGPGSGIPLFELSEVSPMWMGKGEIWLAWYCWEWLCLLGVGGGGGAFWKGQGKKMCRWNGKWRDMTSIILLGGGGWEEGRRKVEHGGRVGGEDCIDWMDKGEVWPASYCWELGGGGGGGGGVESVWGRVGGGGKLYIWKGLRWEMHRLNG